MKKRTEQLPSIDLAQLRNVTGGMRSPAPASTASTTALTTALTSIEQSLAALASQQSSSSGGSSQLMQMMMAMMEQRTGIGIPASTASSGIAAWAPTALPKTYY
jgi:hypothetical protein